MGEDRILFPIRITPRMKELMAGVALEMGRSLNAEILEAIKEHLNNHRNHKSLDPHEKKRNSP